MKIGLYKDSGGGEQNIIEVDEVGNRVLVDYGNDRKVWYGVEDYSTWKPSLEEFETKWETPAGLEEMGEQETERLPIVEEKPTRKKPGRKKKIE